MAGLVSVPQRSGQTAPCAQVDGTLSSRGGLAAQTVSSHALCSLALLCSLAQTLALAPCPLHRLRQLNNSRAATARSSSQTSAALCFPICRSNLLPFSARTAGANAALLSLEGSSAPGRAFTWGGDFPWRTEYRGIIEAENGLGWKGPLKAIQSNHAATSRDIFTQIRLLRAPSSLAWNVSRDGASPTALGNLCQSFTIRIVKNFFLISSLNLLSFSLKPLPLLLQQAVLKSLSTSFF